MIIDITIFNFTNRLVLHRNSIPLKREHRGPLPYSDEEASQDSVDKHPSMAVG